MGVHAHECVREYVCVHVFRFMCAYMYYCAQSRPHGDRHNVLEMPGCPAEGFRRWRFSHSEGYGKNAKNIGGEITWLLVASLSSYVPNPVPCCCSVDPIVFGKYACYVL